MAMEEEDLSAAVIFFGIFFPGNGHVFISTASNYKAEHSNSCTFKCMILSTKGAEFFVNIKSLKGNCNCHFTKKCMEIAPFCIDLSKVLAIILSFSSYLSSLLGVKSLLTVDQYFILASI